MRVATTRKDDAQQLAMYGSRVLTGLNREITDKCPIAPSKSVAKALILEPFH